MGCCGAENRKKGFGAQLQSLYAAVVQLSSSRQTQCAAMPCFWPGKAQPLLGRGLDRNAGNLAADGRGEVFAHLHNMGCELGRLREHGRVQIAEPVSLLAHERRHMAQQRDAVRARIARVGVREVLADVPERERAEQCVHHGVGEHVRVRVAVQPSLMRDIHPANDAFAAGNQPVHVVSMSNAHGQPSSFAAMLLRPGCPRVW